MRMTKACLILRGPIEMAEKTLEEVESFFAFLQGAKMPGFRFSENSPEIKLSAEQAYKIIYVLQEGLRVVPDKYEKCSICNSLYNIEEEGDHTERMVVWYVEEYEEENDIDIPLAVWDSIREALPSMFYCGGCYPRYADGVREKVYSLLRGANCDEHD